MNLFNGISDNEKNAALSCLRARRIFYGKNDTVWNEGDTVTSVGIVISGSVHIVKEDYWGSRHIIAVAGEGEIFGEAFSAAGVKSLPISVTAAEGTEIMFIDCRRLVTPCGSVCEFHTRLVGNMLKILADKNVGLTAKLEHVTRRTTREKLLSYLSEQAKRNSSSQFRIPLNRQELADYLSVERSALSAEMSKLKAESIINYKKNLFEIKVII